MRRQRNGKYQCADTGCGGCHQKGPDDPQQLLFAFCPPGGQAVDFPRHAQYAQRGGKAQLQADRGRRKGIHQQDHQQRRTQRSDRVTVAFEQRRQQQKRLHDAGTHHRRGQAHHRHVKQQHADRHAAAETTAAGRNKEAQQAYQKGTVQTGDGKEMGKANLGDSRVIFR